MTGASSPLKIDLLLLTDGREDWLFECLHSVDQALAGLASDLVVSVSLGTSRKVDLPNFTNLKRVAHYELSNPNQRRTPADLRNEVLSRRTTSSAWTQFIDDDTLLPKDFYRTFLASLQSPGNPGVIGGPNLTPPASAYFERATGIALSSRITTYHTVNRYRAIGAARACGEESLILCNVFIRTALLKNTRFLSGLKCAEENDLLHRFLVESVRLEYFPELFLYHRRRPSPFALARQVFKYGFGRGQICRLPYIQDKGFFLAVALFPFFWVSLALSYSWFGPLSFGVYLIAVAIKAFFLSKEEEVVLWPGIVLAILIVHFFYPFGLLFGWMRGVTQKEGLS